MTGPIFKYIRAITLITKGFIYSLQSSRSPEWSECSFISSFWFKNKCSISTPQGAPPGGTERKSLREVRRTQRQHTPRRGRPSPAWERTALPGSQARVDRRPEPHREPGMLGEMIPGLGLSKSQMGPSIMCQKARQCPSKWQDMSQGHRSPLEGTATDAIWDNCWQWGRTWISWEIIRQTQTEGHSAEELAYHLRKRQGDEGQDETEESPRLKETERRDDQCQRRPGRLSSPHHCDCSLAAGQRCEQQLLLVRRLHCSPEQSIHAHRQQTEHLRQGLTQTPHRPGKNSPRKSALILWLFQKIFFKRTN